MTSARSGEWMDTAPYLSSMDFRQFRLRVSTQRYYSREYLERERNNLWMRVWQIAGRADDIPEVGDRMEYRVLDQSWVLMRGKDRKIRGFVNACRHRGNRLCSGKSHGSLLTCPYHNWTFGLDGTLVAVAKPDYKGTVEEFVGPKEGLGLIQVPVEVFGGFIFLNPDRNAAPLCEFLGEAADALAPYHLEELTPVGVNVRERVNCNWKVIMDAFGEGYHTQGVHRELINVVDLSKERFHAYGDHGVATVPFGAPDLAEGGAERAVEAIMNLPIGNFPGLADALPRFAASVPRYRGQDGRLALPPGVTARSMLQEAVRETYTTKGLDVSGLTDSQMIDYQFWLLFPNVFLQICAGECTTIIAEPDPDGDPNRCFWRVMTLQWRPSEERSKLRTEFTQIAEGDHFPYFLALEQDYRQMAIQQDGLRNRSLESLVLTKQEPRVAHFHASLDSWVE